MEDQEKPNILADAAKKGAKSIASKGAKTAIKVILPILPWILLVVVAVVLVGSVFNVFVSVGQTVAGLWQDFLTSITSPSGTIELTDEKILEFIDQIEKETHVTLNSLKLAGDIEDYNNPDRQAEIEKANIKYVRKFLEAQIATQEVERPGVEGRVFAYRADQNVQDANNGRKLTYKTPNEFNIILENCRATMSEEIKNYFTLNEVGEIVVAGINTTIIDVDGKATVEKDYYTTPINYKSLISQYATPAQFFIYLGEIVQNPEFLAAVVDLIKEDTEIRVTMLENTTTTVTKEVYTYTLHTKQVERDPVTGEIIEEHEDPVTGETVGGITYTSQDITTTTTTTQINTSLTPAVTYVNTWQIEQTMTYEKGNEDAPTQTITTGQGDVPAIPDESSSGEPDSYRTNQVRTTTIDVKTENYNLTHTSDYIYKAGEKPDEHPEYTSFVDLLDKKFKIPNSSREESAGTNFKSGAEWLFTLLAQDTGTQNMEAFMKYVMYKYTGKSYGVTELDTSIFDVNYFNTVGISGSSRIAEILKSYENEALRKYMNGTSSNYTAVEKYVKQDKSQYKLYYTSHDGCLNFSYGIMVRNASGNINNANYFSAEGIDLQTLINQYNSGQDVYVDVEIIDRIYVNIINDRRNLIKSFFEGKGISLKQNELDAFINVSYQYGNCGQYIRDDKNIASLYSNYYEKGDVNSFKNKAQAQTGSGERAYMFDDSSTRKKNNWLLFYEGKYILSDGTELADIGSEVVEFALQFVGEGHSRFTSYNPSNGVSDIWGQGDWCAMFVSYCYNECGLIPNKLPYPYASCKIIGDLYNAKNPNVKIVGNKGVFVGVPKDSYTPSPGDIIFFNWNGSGARNASHTGIVVSCDGTKVYTVEGNATTEGSWQRTKVAQKEYYVNSSEIVGYISINGN